MASMFALDETLHGRPLRLNLQKSQEGGAKAFLHTPGPKRALKGENRFVPASNYQYLTKFVTFKHRVISF